MAWSVSKSNIKISLIFLPVLFVFVCEQAFSASYTYDNANRLIGIDYGNGITVDYTYDANGNTVSKSVNDTTPPAGSIAINDGAGSTNSPPSHSHPFGI